MQFSIIDYHPTKYDLKSYLNFIVWTCN